jgi:Serine/Threonine/Tyrosine Kinase found in polyvalent proteins
MQVHKYVHILYICALMRLDEHRQRQIQDIIHGVSILEPQSTLHATRNFLCTSFSTNTKIKRDFEYQQIIKERQKHELISFAQRQNILSDDFADRKLYLTQGGEAKIFFSTDGLHVIKLNDAIYYSAWLDFINSVCIHNILFPETAYELLGFSLSGELYAVLKQNFIVSTDVVQQS